MAGDAHSLEVIFGHAGRRGVEALLVGGETASGTFRLPPLLLPLMLTVLS